jgi:dihydroorotate dehydrogenase electron transfer subunit
VSDLRRARDEVGEVVAVEELGGGLVELTAHLPHLATTARAGEFAQLRCGPGPVPLLRRPFSVAWVSGDGRCSFVFERVGVGTRLLAAMRPGDLLGSLGPLGVGFTVARGMRSMVCVAGGLGCAPFPLLARQARDIGVERVVVLHGAATAARLYPAARFARGDDAGVRVLEATDDGSRGYRGLVVDLITSALSGDVDAVYACGPNPMLAATAPLVLPRTSGDASARVCEASLEAPMGCGFGTCLGCALPVRRGGDGIAWALCCREGPVMPMDAVDWDGLRALPPAHVA